jgi:hypothetical protein
MSSREMDILRLLELRSRLKQAYSYLDEAKALIAAMMIIDEYDGLEEVEDKMEKALQQLREAKRILEGEQL